MEQVYINNTSFLPMIEIVNPWDFSPDLTSLLPEFDIFQNGSRRFDMQKLGQYFEIEIAVRERNALGSRYTNIDFRVCNSSDFIKRGV